MKLTIIGHWGGFPKSGDASAGYLLEADGFSLLIDCGSGVLSEVQKHIDVNNIDAVIVSHYHADHIADLGVLQHAVMIDCLMNKTEWTLPIYGHKEDRQAFENLNYKQYTIGKQYSLADCLQIGPFTIEFIQTKHSVPCFAMKIKKNDKIFVYTADTAYFDQLVDFAKGAGILLAECNFYKGMDAAVAGHMTSEDVAKVARQANVKQVVLTHLPHFGHVNQLVEEVKEGFSGPVQLAQKGFFISI